MPWEAIENHRTSGDPSRDVLIRWTGMEAEVLRQLGIPTEYYVNPNQGTGLANTAEILVQEWIESGDFTHLIERAAFYPLESPASGDIKS
jgi:hypothetical protein